jgi:hypothetical protein
MAQNIRLLDGAGRILIPLESDADQQSALALLQVVTLSGTNSKHRHVTAATKGNRLGDSEFQQLAWRHGLKIGRMT